MRKERNLYIDLVKAVAIILVVLGHCIQYGSGSLYLSSTTFFENKAFIFIYSFHMPLLMLISGYLFGFSAKNVDSTNNMKRLVIHKVKQIIIPLFCWSFVSLVIDAITFMKKSKVSSITAYWLLKTFVSDFINGPWFLWAIWWCSLAVLFVRQFFKDNPNIYIAGFILAFFIPDEFGLATYKFMYPFFIFGYLWNTNNYLVRLKKWYLNKWFAISIVLAYFILLCFYNRDIYIYTTGYTIIGKDILAQIWNDCFRLIIGLLGSLSILYIIYALLKLLKLNPPKLLCYIGRQTLGIYLISNILVSVFLPKITSGLPGVIYSIAICETGLGLLISLGINWLLQRNRISNTIFLGGR